MSRRLCRSGYREIEEEPLEDRARRGRTVADAAPQLGVSEATYHRWRERHGGLEVQALKRLKMLELEQQNAMVAEQALDIRILNEVAEADSPFS